MGSGDTLKRAATPETHHYRMRIELKGLIAILFFAPLAFATVEPWSLAIMEGASFGLFLLWFFNTAVGETKKDNNTLSLSLLKIPLIIPIGLFIGIVVLQLIPLPPSIIKIISPAAYRIYHETIGNAAGGSLPWLTLSLYPHATAIELSRILSYLVVYFLAVQLLKDRASIERVSALLLIFGCLIALFGIVQKLLYNGKIYWLRTLTEGGSPFGPYVNRNHFAGLMEMLIPIGITIFLTHNTHRYRGRLKETIVEFFSIGAGNESILAGFSIVIMGTALFLSLSRGGIAALSLSMLFMGIMLIRRRSTRSKGKFILVLFSFIFLSVSWFGWDKIIERFEGLRHHDPSAVFRLENWEDTGGMISDFSIFGTGLGTYKYIYPKYKTIPSQEVWEHAHNDYIELASEVGIPGLMLSMYIIFAFIRTNLRLLRQRRDIHARLLSLGALTGIIAILIHSLTDFNLHIGANGLFFSFLMGLSLAASHTRLSNENGGTLLKTAQITIPKGLRIPVSFAVAAIAFGLSLGAFKSAVGDLYFSLVKDKPLSKETPATAVEKRNLIEKAILWDRGNARYYFGLGNIESILQEKDNALKDYSTAVRLNPARAEYLQILGIAYGNIGSCQDAGHFLRLGVIYDPSTYERHRNYAQWLFFIHQREKAIEETKRAIGLDPSKTRAMITTMILNGLDDDSIKGAIPDSYQAYLQYALYLTGVGKDDLALQAYTYCLDLMHREGKRDASVYQVFARFLEDRGDVKRALNVWQEGVNLNPDDPGLRFGLARTYDALHLTYRAKKQYQTLLILQPDNAFARKRLREIEDNH